VWRDLIVTRSGEVVCDRWESMFLVDERYVSFDEGKLNGLFDLVTGSVCIKPQPWELNWFYDNFIVVRHEEEQFLVDLEGRRLSDAVFTRFKGFVDGIAAASILANDWETSLFGFVNEASEWVVEPRFKYLESPAPNGLAAAYDKDHRFFYVDRHGDKAIERTFQWANPFSEGLAGVKDEEEEFYVDESGKTVFQEGHWYHSAKFKDGLALVMSRRVEYHVLFINKFGDDVFDRVFPKAASFRNGIAPVQIGKRWGAIDADGRVCIDPKFEELDTTTSDLLRAQLDGKAGFVDRRGNWVLPPKYDVALRVCGELCHVRLKK
jgi:hypothetical protein